MNTEEPDRVSGGTLPLKFQTKPKKKNAPRPLLTNERSQKFDLLLHLITNIRDGIVICGPNGIGKSMMLDLVQTSGMKNWSVCRINVVSSTCFEEIQDSIAESIAFATKNSPQNHSAVDLNNQLERFKSDGKFLVLLLDNAGDMAPGVLTAVCRFAGSSPALRPVFTMTADRLHLTLSSDPALANCQVIEIPPLTESQSGEFLQNLSGKPGALVSFKAVSPAMVQYVYRKSHGVPGNIIAILPELSKEQFIPPQITSWPIVALLTLIGAACAGYFLWNTNGNTTGPVQFPPPSGVEQRGGMRESVSTDRGKADSGETAQKTIGEVHLRETPESIEVPVVSEKSDNANAAEQTLLEFAVFPENPDETLEEITGSLSGLEEAVSQSTFRSGGPDSSMALNGPEELDSRARVAAPMIGLGEEQGMEKESSDNTLAEQVKATEPLLTTEEKSGIQTSDAETQVTEKKEESGSSEIARTEMESEGSSSPAELLTSTSLVEGVSGQSWILQQDPTSFTLQLLATVKLDAMKQFVKSNPQLDDLAIFKTNRDGTIWYALIRGVYPSLTEAKQAAEKLPKKLHNAWPRRFKSVQNAMIDSE